MNGRGKTTPGSTAGSFAPAAGVRSRAVPDFHAHTVVPGVRVLVAGEPGEAMDVIGDHDGRKVVVQFDAGDLVKVPVADVAVEDIPTMSADHLRDLLGRYTEDDFESCAETLAEPRSLDGDDPSRAAYLARVQAWLDRYDRMQDALFALEPPDPNRGGIGDDDPF